MGIPIPSAGKIFYTQFACDTEDSIINGLSSALAQCGWGNACAPANATLIVGGVPSNGDTLTIGLLTYVFVSPANFNNSVPNQITLQTPVSTAIIATRILEAINAGTGGGGTDYSSATVPNGQFFAQTRAGFPSTLQITATSPIAQTPTLLSSTSNIGFTGVSDGGPAGSGSTMVAAQTPQGLSGLIEMTPQSGYVAIQMGTPAGGAFSGGSVDRDPGVFSLATGKRTQEFCGCAHQFFSWVRGDAASPGLIVCGGIPYVRSYHMPLLLRCAYPGTPVIAQTVAPHGLITGQPVFICDILGLSNGTTGNGQWIVTVMDAYTFSLNGSSATADYISGGVVATDNQIGRCLWMNGTSVGTFFQTFRSNLGPGTNGAGNNFFGCVNSSYWSTWNNPSGLMLEIPKVPNSDFVNNGIVQNWGNIPDETEARIAWSLTNKNAGMMKYGQLWAAFVDETPLPMDRIRKAFPIGSQSHDCINFTDGAQEPRGGLWLLKN